MKKKTNLKYLLPILICLILIVSVLYYFFFCSLSKNNETCYLYVDEDDNIDSVLVKIKPITTPHGFTGFSTLLRHTGSEKSLYTGRYAIEESDGAVNLFRRLRNGMQTPVHLTIPTVRTMDKMAAYLGEKLMIDSTTVIEALTDAERCQALGFDTLTIPALFIPNTYDIYWNISLDNFLERMKKENDTFWNEERTRKASQLKLTPTEVVTLASIIDEETSNDGEKPMIAGMYYNRLQTDMPLQADPTIKFAIGDFSLKRIYHNMLFVNSPYNTYKNTGLPPGPIRVPTIAGIDAVLNMVHHNYLYMCAKEDFSGTHRFAHTYQEHLKNAELYSKALNERGIQ
ncbi:MAG: endolytic transglycosylase MltG [Prevotella sp.]|nr:endolytic transglycosylase MltG [Prevotella sp.]